MQESEYNLPGYALFSMNVNVEHYRGIIVYIDNSFAASQFDVSNLMNVCVYKLNVVIHVPVH